MFALLITDFSTVRQKGTRVPARWDTDQLVQPLVILSLDADVRVYLLMLRTRAGGRMRSVSKLDSQVKHSNQGSYLHREYIQQGLPEALGRVSGSTACVQQERVKSGTLSTLEASCWTMESNNICPSCTKVRPTAEETSQVTADQVRAHQRHHVTEPEWH